MPAADGPVFVIVHGCSSTASRAGNALTVPVLLGDEAAGQVPITVCRRERALARRYPPSLNVFLFFFCFFSSVKGRDPLVCVIGSLRAFGSQVLFALCAREHICLRNRTISRESLMTATDRLLECADAGRTSRILHLDPGG